MTSEHPERPVYIPTRKRKKAAAEEERVNRRVGAYFRFDDVIPEAAGPGNVKAKPFVSNNAVDFMDAQDYNEWAGLSMKRDRGLSLLRQLGIRKTADGDWIWKRRTKDEGTPVVRRIPSQVSSPVISKPRIGVGYTASSLRVESNAKRSVAGFSLRDDDDDNVYDDEDADNGVGSIWNRIHQQQQQASSLSTVNPSYRNARAANLVAYEPVEDSDPEDAVSSGTAWTKLQASSDRSNVIEQPLPGFATGAPCIQRYYPGPEVPVDWDIYQVQPCRALPPHLVLPPLPVPGAPPSMMPLPPLPPSLTAALPSFPSGPPPFLPPPPPPSLPPPIVPLPRPPIVALPQPPLPVVSTPAGPWASDVRAAMQARFAVASSEHDTTRKGQDDQQTIAPDPSSCLDEASFFTRTGQAFHPESLLCKRFQVGPPRPM
jgi:hypothetical protein